MCVCERERESTLVTPAPAPTMPLGTPTRLERPADLSSSTPACIRKKVTVNVLRFCPGKMRVCRLKAAKWRRGLGVLVNPRRSSALPSGTCQRVAHLSRVGTTLSSSTNPRLHRERNYGQWVCYRGTSLIRNFNPPRNTKVPEA